MNRLLSIAAILSFGALSAAAGTVTFNTNGSELCLGANGCGVASQTIGSTIITYVPNSGITLNTFSYTNFGDLIMSCVGGGTACGSNSLTGLNLFIEINQLTPASGSGFIPVGSIQGTLSGTSSQAGILWGANPFLSITTPGFITTYGISNPILSLVPPTNNNCVSCTIKPSGLTTIQAQVSQTPTPEPSSIVLLSSGLVCLLVGRKRAA